MSKANSMEVQREILNETTVKRPDPPSDIAERFKESTYIAFYGYLEARPYSKWTIPDLRQLAQVALLEDFIAEAIDDVVMDGITSIGSQGQKVGNPAMAAMIKAQQQQGSMLRRLGIAVDGVTAAGEARKMAQTKNKINQAQDTAAPPNQTDKNGQRLNLLA